jgi:hypothetical protein
MDLLGQSDSEIQKVFDQLWSINSTLLISGWTNFSDQEFLPEAAQSLIMAFHKVHCFYIVSTYQR